MHALIREISPSLAQCVVTHIEREPIVVPRAQKQHAAYAEALSRFSTIEVIPAHADYPDCVFIEDTAVVFDEVAVLAYPGALSRRGEIYAVGPYLEKYRPLKRISAPATLDGGDVLTVGKTVYVGVGYRTNAAGADQLSEILREHCYRVVKVAFQNCLHLKTAVSFVGDESVLLNPDWVSADVFSSFQTISVDPAEPFAANALKIESGLFLSASAKKTADKLEKLRFPVEPLDLSELAKAEGGLTCCSLLVPNRRS